MSISVDHSRTVAQIRRVDAIAIHEFGMLGLVLMENAGANAASWIRQAFTSPTEVTILCGTGNNGGDGFVIARHLYHSGWRPSVWLLGDANKLSPDAKANRDILLKTQLPVYQCDRIDSPDDAQEMGAFSSLKKSMEESKVIVDAMLGTGASGALREPIRSAVQFANRCHATRIAIDIPTGLDADTGAVDEVVFCADQTLTLVCAKRGFENEVAKACLGQVHTLPIGVPPEVLKRAVQEDVGGSRAS